MSDEIETVAGDEGERITRSLAYIRPVRQSDLPDAPAVATDQLLYALHDENGRPLAIFKDRATAVVVARTNDFTALSVH